MLLAKEKWVSGGLMPCRQLEPFSRREYVNESNKNASFKNQPFKNSQSFENSQTTYKSLYSAAAFKKSKITSGLAVLKRSCIEAKQGTW